MNCQHCGKGWSAEDMVLSYMKICHDIHLSHFPEDDIRKLKTMILHHEIHGMPGQQNPAIVNAAYNHHIHYKNCFDIEAAKTISNTRHEKIISESCNNGSFPELCIYFAFGRISFHLHYICISFAFRIAPRISIFALHFISI